MTLRRVVHTGPMKVVCPKCGAPAGVRCQNASYHQRSEAVGIPFLDWFHQERIDAAPLPFPEPTTSLTSGNVRAAAECVEFLLEYIRKSKRGHTSKDQRWLRDEGRERFHETNWITLVKSMEAWAEVLERDES